MCHTYEDLAVVTFSGLVSSYVQNTFGKSEITSCIIMWTEVHAKLTLTDYNFAVCFQTAK